MRYLSNSGETYRVRIEQKWREDGPTRVSYVGPYARLGTARAQATRFEREQRRRERWSPDPGFLRTRVERSATEWVPVDEEVSA